MSPFDVALETASVAAEVASWGAANVDAIATAKRTMKNFILELNLI